MSPKVGPGRPSIGEKRIEARVETELKEAVGAYAKAQGTTEAAAIRELLLSGLKAAEQGDTIWSELDPATTDEPTATEAPAPTDPKGAILATYRNLSTPGQWKSDPTSWLPLATLREALPQFSRTTLDDALTELFDSRDIDLMPEENQKVLTDRDRDAALWLGASHKHFLVIPT